MASVAVVTGGAGDIGRAIAAKLGESHDRVVLVDRDETKANAVVEALGKEKFSSAICDITNSTQVDEMAKKVLSLGTLRTLVNNAGGTTAGSLHDTTVESWKRETTLNLDPVFLCFRSFADALKESKGSVINTASVNGLGIFGNPAYSAAKAGIVHLTRSIAVEYGRFGIRCNAVAPGTVRTVAWEDRAKANPQVFEEAKRWYALKRIIDPEDVANAVAFLSSDQASAITGVTLPVDAGLTAGQANLAYAFSQSEGWGV